MLIKLKHSIQVDIVIHCIIILSANVPFYRICPQKLNKIKYPGRCIKIGYTVSEWPFPLPEFIYIPWFTLLLIIGIFICSISCVRFSITQIRHKTWHEVTFKVLHPVMVLTLPCICLLINMQENRNIISEIESELCRKGPRCYDYMQEWFQNEIRAFKVIIYSYLILKKMNERITDS